MYQDALELLAGLLNNYPTLDSIEILASDVVDLKFRDIDTGKIYKHKRCNSMVEALEYLETKH